MLLAHETSAVSLHEKSERNFQEFGPNNPPILNFECVPDRRFRLRVSCACCFSDPSILLPTGAADQDRKGHRRRP